MIGALIDDISIVLEAIENEDLLDAKKLLIDIQEDLKIKEITG